MGKKKKKINLFLSPSGPIIIVIIIIFIFFITIIIKYLTIIKQNSDI